MKKTILLVVAVVMIASLLLASGPALRVVRLTVINKSGNDVFLKLEGSDIGKQFYYLTIPAGTKTFPTVRVFTVVEDVYTRTTTYGEGKYDACVGVSSSGQLVMASNVRLNFVPCAYGTPTRRVEYCQAQKTGYGWQEGDIVPAWKCENWPGSYNYITVQEPNFGEPTMEKVMYQEWLTLRYASKGWWDEEWKTYDSWDDLRLNVYWKRGCGFNTFLYWYVGAKRFPARGLCRWRYLYDKTHEW